jgi:hypothetical protein
MRIYFLPKIEEKRQMINDHIEEGKFAIPFDLREQETSNTLISGANKTGKSRLACGIASILQNFNWRIVVFDNSGIWKRISDVPTFHRIREPRNDDLTHQDRYYPFPRESLIFDMSLLIPDLQKSFVNDVLERLWNVQVRSSSKRWTLVVLEEAQLYMRNIRGSVAQNLLRICSAGRNNRLRVLAVSTDLALLDASFIRLTSQRYYSRLNIEENSKRKFRNYHGLDWTRIATELDLGYFVYLFRDKLKIIYIPCFETKRTPQPYHIPMPTPLQPRPRRSLLQRFRELIR